MTQQKIFESYHKMLDNMHRHVKEHGFHVEHWDQVLSRDDGVAGAPDRIGFRCTEVDIVWHMNAEIFSEQMTAVVGESYKTKEGKDKYLDALKHMFMLPLPKPEKVCKVEGCDKVSKKEGFCGWCFRKYQKGLLDIEGDKVRTWDEVKADVSAKLDVDKLRAFGDENPEFQKTFGCEKLNIFVDPIVCLGRIFLADHPKKECKKCRLHDSKFPILEAFLDKNP